MSTVTAASPGFGAAVADVGDEALVPACTEDVVVVGRAGCVQRLRWLPVRAPLLPLLISGVLLLAGCSSAAPSSGSTSAPAVTSSAAPASTGSAAEREQALSAVPESLAKVSAEQREAACAAFAAGPDEFLAAFQGRFDAVFSPITDTELATVRGTLTRVCAG